MKLYKPTPKSLLPLSIPFLPQDRVAERVKIIPRKIGTRIKILTPNKLLRRFPLLLAQIEAGTYSCKLKYETKQIPHLLY